MTTAIWAHRGASATERENTVAAFATAVALGADGVELDVHLAADGRLLVHHDDLPAVTPSWVPTLADALEACGDLVVNVEIKRAPAAAVVDALAGRRRDRLVVSSFDAAVVAQVHRIDPDLPTGLLTYRPPTVRVIERCRRDGHVALHPHHLSVNQRLIDRCRAAGLAVHTWTVDDPERVRQLAALGVDAIVTNVPDVARRALGRDS